MGLNTKKNKIMNVLKHVALIQTLVFMLKLIYWFCLYVDFKASAVMPQEKYYKELKANKYKPF